MAAVPAAATLLLATLALNNPATKLAHKNKNQQKPTTSLPSNIWVDKPQNTALRDDRLEGVRDTRGIDTYLRETYAREAAGHPGVRLAAVSAAS